MGGMMTGPSYDELLAAFREYAEATSNNGAAYLPTEAADIAGLEDDIARAWDMIERAEKPAG